MQQQAQQQEAMQQEAQHEHGTATVVDPSGSGDRIEDLSDVAGRAVLLVDSWLLAAAEAEKASERRTTQQLAGVVADPAGVKFGMGFVDRVIRPEDNAVAAGQLAQLVEGQQLPEFLSPIDRLLLRAGAKLGTIIPGIVMPLARRRMRSLIGHLVVDADSKAMSRHLGKRRASGFSLNINLLGEAVLGDREAARRHDEAMRLLNEPDIDYVSVKVSAVVSQLNHWDFEGCLERVVEALRPLFRQAMASSPETFINLDMEEYHDLELTVAAFKAVLGDPEFHSVDAGIVLQAYLPDAYDALRDLSAWATERGNTMVNGAAGGSVKVRLVKGANLAMERVDADMHGWPLATHHSKAETDASYKRCVDWLFHPDRLTSMKVGIASHNLYDLAFAKLLASDRGVTDRVEFEMLEGMAPTHARLLKDDASGMLLYTPVVAADEFDVAISYLFRRLEENASDENFIHHLFTLEPGSPATLAEAQRFRTAVRERLQVKVTPNRCQDRNEWSPQGSKLPFENAPDTDPAVAANREWAKAAIASADITVQAPQIDDVTEVDAIVDTAKAAQAEWFARSPHERREILFAVADEMERRRGDLLSCAVHEARKTVAQADPEISEAIDFARYYGDRAVELIDDTATFAPLGVIAVTPPWNFPIAIPTGGVMASLAAGNGVLLKPAPETQRCAELIAECCWAAGVPTEVMQFVRVPDNEVGQHLISHPDVDAVILTGAYETSEMFRSWRPDLRIFAETSGKNALIITPNADLDLAVADLVYSAFGHAGQKCSAASLAILVGDVYESERFRRQLIDATASLQVGEPTDLSTTVNPLIAQPTAKLERGLTLLDDGEAWLVQPERLSDDTWTPGVRVGVQPGSWFHQTECFGPVLGIMRADSLEEAVALQNGTAFGLTGGLHSLDRSEIDYWLDNVQIGNAYVNRPTTGAIVQRQPFGGWKRSTIGPGAKAGGTNYVAQLGTWLPDGDAVETNEWLDAARASDADAWEREFSIEHDPSGLFCESNRFRYRPITSAMLRVEASGRDIARQRVLAAAERCGVPVTVSTHDDESPEAFADRLRAAATTGLPDRVRIIGPVHPAIAQAANELGVHIADEPVLTNGRRELLHFLREQSISESTHRYGNLLGT